MKNRQVSQRIFLGSQETKQINGRGQEKQLLNHVKVYQRIPGWKTSHEIFCHGREYDVDSRLIGYGWMSLRTMGVPNISPPMTCSPFPFSRGSELPI